MPMLATLTPQEAVNRRDKPSDCNTVIVILWSRMGTPLPPEYRKPTGEPYRSGTEWEYEEACSARPPPNILVYRRTEEPKVGIKDPAREEKFRQYALVEQFFARFRNPDGSLRGGVTEYATPTDFKDRLASDLKHILRERLDEPDPRLAAPVEPLWTGSPYPGLRAFTSEEAAIFFGRERETDALITRLRDPDQRFLAVVGASGTGKSSLVRAGLLPRLKNGAIEGSQFWRVLTFTPAAIGDNKFLSLDVYLVEIMPKSKRKPPRLVAKEISMAPQALTDYALELLMARPPGAQLVLFIDQMEELFNFSAEVYRPSFINLLSHAANDQYLRVIITLRADFLLQRLAEPKLTALLQANAFLLGPPNPLVA